MTVQQEVGHKIVALLEAEGITNFERIGVLETCKTHYLLMMFKVIE
jgi:hypothetical protein